MLFCCDSFPCKKKVQGSKGNTYILDSELDWTGKLKITCTCAAYKYRRKFGKEECKHIEKDKQENCNWTGDENQVIWTGFDSWICPKCNSKAHKIMDQENMKNEST